MTAESVQAAASRVRKHMELEEARKILGVEANTPWPEVTQARAHRAPPGLPCSTPTSDVSSPPAPVQRFERMFDSNSKSFYLQSKARATVWRLLLSAGE